MDTTILELDQAAARLHSSKHFIRLLISNGELPFVKISKRFCIVQGDLDRWIETARGHHGEADLPRTTSKNRVNGKAASLKAAKSAA